MKGTEQKLHDTSAIFWISLRHHRYVHDRQFAGFAQAADRRWDYTGQEQLLPITEQVESANVRGEFCAGNRTTFAT